MKKRIFFFFTFFFLIAMVWVSLPLEISKKVVPKEANGEENRGILVQVSEREGGRGERDSYETALLRQLKAKVDAWLKSLNERIESEDITRLEVRFLEILRNILEWVKEKIDAKLGVQEEKKLKKEVEKEDDSWVDPRELTK